MCQTVHTLMQTVICFVQMLVRVFMTIILMIENLLRLILQTIYNFLSFMMQLCSLIPICLVFMLTSRLKCFMCGGGGPCPVNRGGACDCLMSAIAIVIVFFIFRSTGVLDKIFYKMGYAKAVGFTKFVPSAGLITDCSRKGYGYRRHGDSGKEELEDTELLTLDGHEPKEGEEREEIENDSLSYNETVAPDEGTESEVDKMQEERAGPDEKVEPEEEGHVEKGELEEKAKGELEEKEKGELEEKENGEVEEEGKTKEAKNEDKTTLKKNGELEEQRKTEEKEKSTVLRKNAFKVTKNDHEANLLDSNLGTTVVYYLV